MKHIKLFENYNIADIDAICKKYRIENYTINDDGSIDVDGHVDLKNKEIEELPLKFNKIYGSFTCSGNGLTTLKGSPIFVEKTFACYDNKLTSLEHCPQYIGGDFLCTDNYITDQKYTPIDINGVFGIGFRLESLNILNKMESCGSILTNNFFLHYVFNMLGGDLDDIKHFNSFGIITDEPGMKPTFNLRRFEKFIKLSDLVDYKDKSGNDPKYMSGLMRVNRSYDKV